MNKETEKGDQKQSIYVVFSILYVIRILAINIENHILHLWNNNVIVLVWYQFIEDLCKKNTPTASQICSHLVDAYS